MPLRHQIERWLQVGLGCIQLSPSCPFRPLHTFHFLRPARLRTPLLGYGAPHLSARGTLTLLNNALLSAHFLQADFSGANPNVCCPLLVQVSRGQFSWLDRLAVTQVVAQSFTLLSVIFLSATSGHFNVVMISLIRSAACAKDALARSQLWFSAWTNVTSFNPRKPRVCRMCRK